MKIHITAAALKNHLFIKSDIISRLLYVNSLILASKQLALRYDSENQDEEYPLDPSDDLTLKNHYDYAEPLILSNLLYISTTLRAADDINKSNIGNDVYKRIFDNFGEDIIFSKDHKGREYNLRQCWNKIIHAAEIRPVYTKTESVQEDHDLWYMDGTVELTAYPGENWDKLNMYIPAFIEWCFEWLNIVTKP